MTVVSAKTLTKDVTFAYQKPTEGLVEGVVTVTGAPSGFTGYTGAIACQGTKAADCATPTISYLGETTYQLLVPAGTWNVAGDYQLSFGGGTVTGPDTSVKVVAGVTTKVTLFVHYVAPGAVLGLVTVTGIPSGTHIEDAIVVACPATEPYVPPAAPGPLCTENSTPLEADYSLTTLPPGSWLLYPGYAATTSYYVSPKSTPVTVTSSTVSTRNLTVAYQGEGRHHRRANRWSDPLGRRRECVGEYLVAGRHIGGAGPAPVPRVSDDRRIVDRASGILGPEGRASGRRLQRDERMGAGVAGEGVGAPDEGDGVRGSVAGHGHRRVDGPPGHERPFQTPGRRC